MEYKKRPFKYGEKYYVMIGKNKQEITIEVARVMESTRKKQLRQQKEEREYLVYYFAKHFEEASFLEHFADEKADVHEILMKKETYRELYEKLELLGQKEREIIDWCFFEDKTQEEIAKLLKITQPRVSQKLKAILKKIRKMYE